jgi:hypothetical protein
MVHYGSVPESVLTEEVENGTYSKGELTDHPRQTLRSLTKTCNAMKQYRRRTEASREAVRRAKAILEGDRQKSGQRLGGGSIRRTTLRYSDNMVCRRAKLGETRYWWFGQYQKRRTFASFGQLSSKSRL